MSRKAKLPSSDGVALESLLKESVLKILDKRKAPSGWRKKEISLGLVSLALNPIGAVFGPVRFEAVAYLYAEAPDTLLEVMQDLREKAKQSWNSPEFAAAAHLIENGFSTEKAEALALSLSKELRLPVSKKVVSHARERVRKAKL